MMPTNEERDDLTPSLKQLVALIRNPSQNTVTLSTFTREAVTEINRILRPTGNQLTETQSTNPAGKTGTMYSATLTTEAAAQLMNKLNNNPLLQAMGQSIAARIGQTPGGPQSTTPTPFNTGIPQLKRDK